MACGEGRVESREGGKKRGVEAGSPAGRGGTEGKKGQGGVGGGGSAEERARNPPPTYVILN